MSDTTPESQYGKQGTPYLMGEEKIFINTQFIVATMMGMIVVMRDVLGKDYTTENGLQIDQLIEGIAAQLYDQITPID